MRKEAPTERNINPFDGKLRAAPANIRRTTLDGRDVPAKAQEETMIIKLKADYTVCRDGIHLESFKVGDQVDMPAPIASVLIGDGRAIVQGQVKIEPGAPENKMEKGTPENKGKPGKK
jgi:hypothetical protein